MKESRELLTTSAQTTEDSRDISAVDGGILADYVEIYRYGNSCGSVHLEVETSLNLIHLVGGEMCLIGRKLFISKE